MSESTVIRLLQLAGIGHLRSRSTYLVDGSLRTGRGSGLVVTSRGRYDVG